MINNSSIDYQLFYKFSHIKFELTNASKKFNLQNLASMKGTKIDNLLLINKSLTLHDLIYTNLIHNKNSKFLNKLLIEFYKNIKKLLNLISIEIINYNNHLKTCQFCSSLKVIDAIALNKHKNKINKFFIHLKKQRNYFA